MSCVSQARARAGQLLFLRRNDLRGHGLAGTDLLGDLRGRTFCIRPLVHARGLVGTDLLYPSPCSCQQKNRGTDTKGPSPCPHKRTVPMSPCLLRWTRFFDLEQVVDPGRKVFSQQSGGSDDDRHFSSGDDDHFALERPVYAFLRGLYRGDLFS